MKQTYKCSTLVSIELQVTPLVEVNSCWVQIAAHGEVAERVRLATDDVKRLHKQLGDYLEGKK